MVTKNTPMKNVRPTTNPLNINLPDGTIVKSTHILYATWKYQGYHMCVRSTHHCAGTLKNNRMDHVKGVSSRLNLSYVGTVCFGILVPVFFPLFYVKIVVPD
jgi:putative effector of murein hydrolase